MERAKVLPKEKVLQLWLSVSLSVLLVHTTGWQHWMLCGVVLVVISLFLGSLRGGKPKDCETQVDNLDPARETAKVLPQEKVLQQWLDQGDGVVTMLGATPTAIALDNSIRTAIQEEDRRVFLRNLGSDLQDVSDERIKAFHKDWPYMIAVKRAFATGILGPSPQSNHKHRVDSSSDAIVKKPSISVCVAQPRANGVCTTNILPPRVSNNSALYFEQLPHSSAGLSEGTPTNANAFRHGDGDCLHERGVKYSFPRVPIKHSSETTKYIHRVDTVETKARGVFVSWATKSNGTEACYTAPIKCEFNTFGREKNLVDEWKIACIVHRRDPKVEGNKKLAGSKEGKWPWDAFVTIGEEGKSAEMIGRHIAASFTAFARKQKFAFNRVASNGTALRPLTYYLLDDDALMIFKTMFASCNTKECMMRNDEILDDFFGSAEKGRSLLEGLDWDIEG